MSPLRVARPTICLESSTTGTGLIRCCSMSVASSATVAESRMLMTGEVINSSAVVATTRRSSSSKGVPASATITASRNVTIDGMSTVASRWMRSASVTIPTSSP